MKKHQEQNELILNKIVEIRLEMHNLSEHKRISMRLKYQPKAYLRHERDFNHVAVRNSYAGCDFERLVDCLVGLTTRLALLKTENALFPFVKSEKFSEN